MARKDRTAKADHSRIAQDFADTLGRQGLVVHRGAFNPFITAIGFDQHRKCR